MAIRSKKKPTKNRSRSVKRRSNKNHYPPSAVRYAQGDQRLVNSGLAQMAGCTEVAPDKPRDVSFVESLANRLLYLNDIADSAIKHNAEFWHRFEPAPANPDKCDNAAGLPSGVYGVWRLVESLEIKIQQLQQQGALLHKVA